MRFSHASHANKHLDKFSEPVYHRSHVGNQANGFEVVIMANYKEELSWDNVTDNSCPDIAKDAFAELAIAMDAFEEIFQKAAPKGKKAVFNYRHGNNGLSVGVALATDKSRNGSGFNWLPAK